MDALKGVIRRQWWVALIALGVSGGVAFVASSRLQETLVTAHMTLRAQAIPGAGPGSGYVPPTPNAAASIIQSSQFITDVATAQSYEVTELLQNLKVQPNQANAMISLSMTSPSEEKSEAVLSYISDVFSKAMTEYRQALLSQHHAYLTKTRTAALQELSTARERVAVLREQMEKPSGNPLLDAQIQSLVDQQVQLKSAMEEEERSIARVRRDVKFLLSESEDVFRESLDTILKARQRQVSELGKGLTGSTRASARKESMEQELEKLEADVAAFLAGDESVLKLESEPSVGQTSEVSQDAATAASGVAASGVAGSEPALSETDLSESEDRIVLRERQLVEWRRRIESIGGDTLAALSPEVNDTFVAALTRFKQVRREVRLQEWDLAEYESHLAENTDRLRMVTDEINRKGRMITDDLNYNDQLEAEAALSVQEARYNRLVGQLDEIEQVKNCPIPEYIVSSAPAVISENDIKSNRMKIFVGVMVGVFGVLCAPSVLVELLRLKPSPVAVISRRWNLPALGIQSSMLSSRMSKQERAAIARHELRLMALRIQQSLFDPKRRVVLFSGLDHEESPMGLIRALSKCFVQREESVLMIQTLPCQVEIAKRLADKSGSNKSGRPGVAEFLAGEVDDASQLVVSSGIAGIDYLPGGCTASHSEAMASSRLTKLIDQFRDKYSIILMSGPSTLHPADLQMLAARADGIVFTVNRQSLSSVYGTEVINDLIELGAPILGFAEQPVAGKKNSAERDQNDVSKSATVITLPA